MKHRLVHLCAAAVLLQLVGPPLGPDGIAPALRAENGRGQEPAGSAGAERLDTLWRERVEDAALYAVAAAAAGAAALVVLAAAGAGGFKLRSPAKAAAKPLGPDGGARASDLPETRRSLPEETGAGAGGTVWPASSGREAYERSLALVQAGADAVNNTCDAANSTIGTLPPGTRYVKWALGAVTNGSVRHISAKNLLEACHGRGTSPGTDIAGVEALPATGRPTVMEIMERAGAREVGQLSDNVLKKKEIFSEAQPVVEGVGAGLFVKFFQGGQKACPEPAAPSSGEEEQADSFAWLER